MPNIADIEPKIFPIEVTGKMSPYPTVVKVATAHHIAEGMLENLSGWVSFSAKKTPVAQIIRRQNIRINEEINSDLFLKMVLVIMLKVFE